MQISGQHKSEEDILASMVKSREFCRQAGKSLAAARAAAVERGGESGASVELVAAADRAITQMLSHLQKVPLKMAEAMSSNETREYAARLLLEISELLEKAMIMERETRDIIGSVPAAGQRTRRAARAYSEAGAI